MDNLQDDIIKYKKGELSPNEMYTLEKRALSDPFLAEALEGIENISSKNLVTDIEDLNRKISKKQKTVLFSPLRIAAGVILVSASIFLFYQFKPKRDAIALKTEKQNEQTSSPKEKATEKEGNALENSKQGEGQENRLKETTEEFPKREKEKAKADEIATEIIKPKIESQPMIAQTKITVAEKKVDEVKPALNKSQAIVAMEPAKEVAELDLKNVNGPVASKKAKYKSEALSGSGLVGKAAISKPISGKVISAEDGQPLPGVNVVIEGTSSGTVTDADGDFTLQTLNENQRLVFTFIGLQKQEVNIEGKDKVDVELKPDVTQLSEVVVTGLGTMPDDDVEPVINLANPVGGKKAYNKYLEANTRYPQEALKNNIKGKVRVEFAVHADGSVDEYKVVKSLGYGCDEEVIRLIKEGPKWLPTTENGRPVESTVRVGVKFDPAKTGG
jgi:TonB family protein